MEISNARTPGRQEDAHAGAGPSRPGVLAVCLFTLALMLPFASLAQDWQKRSDWNIRVVLSDDKAGVQCGGALNWTADGKKLGATNEVVDIRRVDQTVKLVLGNKGFSAARLVATPAKGYVRYGGKDYRGRLEFFPAKSTSGVVVLNVLPLEEYLLGVVGDEMPESWPSEALAAQAVAARTYAVSRMLGRSALSYDVYDDQADQVYNGLKAEDPRVTKAVQATAGVILTYGGAPISAMYCSDCGTATRQGKAPYLQSVPSPAPDSPNREWTVALSADKLTALCAAAGGSIGPVSSAEAEYDPQSGHLVRLNLTGPRGCFGLGGNKLRELLGLSVMKSTQVRLEAPGGQAARPGRPGQAQPSALAPLEAVEISLGGGLVPEAAGPDGGVATQAFIPDLADASESADIYSAEPVLASAAIAPFARPWVLWRSGQGAAKLRLLYACNGQSLVRCDKEMSVVSASGGGAPAAIPAPPVAAGSSCADLPLQPVAAVPASETLSVGPEGLVLRGSGYGHGVGMSQYSAKELAVQGWDWRRIVTHFYTGVAVEQLPQAALYCSDPALEALPGEAVDALLPDAAAGPPPDAAPEQPRERDGFYDPFRPAPQ